MKENAEIYPASLETHLFHRSHLNALLDLSVTSVKACFSGNAICQFGSSWFTKIKKDLSRLQSRRYCLSLVIGLFFNNFEANFDKGYKSTLLSYFSIFIILSAFLPLSPSFSAHISAATHM